MLLVDFALNENVVVCAVYHEAHHRNDEICYEHQDVILSTKSHGCCCCTCEVVKGISRTIRETSKLYSGGRGVEYGRRGV